MADFGVSMAWSRRESTSVSVAEHDEAAAWARLNVLAPHAMHVLRPEVERRWKLHQERARTTLLRFQSKSAIIRSVERDVLDGVLG